MPQHIDLTETDIRNLPERDSDGLYTVDARVRVTEDDRMELVELMGKKLSRREKRHEGFEDIPTEELLA
jgi:hypothetical protein